MERNEIIEQIYNDPRFNECISRMEPEDLRDDLKSEVALILLNQPERKLKTLHRKGELIYYAIRIVNTATKGNRTPFNRKHKSRMTTVPYNIVEEPIDTERAEREAKEEPVFEIILRIKQIAYQENPTYVTELFPVVNWYSQYMLSLYLKLGTYRAMENETGILWESCYKTVTKAKEQLKKYVSGTDNTLLTSLCLCIGGSSATG